MSDTIFLRVGTADKITLTQFIDSLTDFKSVLWDLDAAVSNNRAGNVDWEVVTLQKNSPALIGVAPRPRRGREDNSAIVERQLIENARLLSTTGDRTKFLSDSALQKIERLAARSKRLGPMAVYLDGDGGPIKQQADITAITYEKVRELTKVKYSDFGTIYGSLDAISVHKDNEFRVWNEENNRAVRCKFQQAEFEQVRALLASRVMVTGTIESNAAGLPVTIHVEELSPVTEMYVPTIDEIYGLVPNITEGLSLREYMERLSNE